MRIVCISDTHNMHADVEVPEGDLLLHAGDMTGRGTSREIKAFALWFATQPHRHKVLIAGNHDFLFEGSPERARALVEAPGVTYLEDSETEIEGLKIWGSPWQPWFHDWAFNLERGAQLKKRWAKIPDDVELLITHGPPFGVLDQVARGGHSVGCEELSLRLAELSVGLHLFGHIHEAYGVQRSEEGRLSINASIATLQYQPTQAPVVVDWDPVSGFAERPR